MPQTPPPSWAKCPHCNGENGIHTRESCAQKRIFEHAKEEFIETLAAAFEHRGWILERPPSVNYEPLEYGKEKEGS